MAAEPIFAKFAAPADYIGCMKTGPVIKSPKYRWYEPQHTLIGAEYFAHAWGEHKDTWHCPMSCCCCMVPGTGGRPTASEQYRCTIHMHDSQEAG